MRKARLEKPPMLAGPGALQRALQALPAPLPRQACSPSPCKRHCQDAAAARPLDAFTARAAVLDYPPTQTARPPPSSGEAIPNSTSGAPSSVCAVHLAAGSLWFHHTPGLQAASSTVARPLWSPTGYGPTSAGPTRRPPSLPSPTSCRYAASLVADCCPSAGLLTCSACAGGRRQSWGGPVGAHRGRLCHRPCHGGAVPDICIHAHSGPNGRLSALVRPGHMDISFLCLSSAARTTPPGPLDIITVKLPRPC